MKKLLLILLCVPLIGIGQPETKKEYFDNGQIKSQGSYIDGKEEGYWKFYYETGQLRLEVNYTDGKKDGLLNEYYKNGQLRYEANYIDGQSNGLSKNIMKMVN